MPRAAIAVIAGGCAAALAATLLAAASHERLRAFAVNPRPVSLVATARPGEEACQRHVQAPASFDAVELRLGTGPNPGGPLAITVRAAEGRRVIARGRLAAGARDNADAVARVSPRVPEDTYMDVCMRNTGERDISFYGGPAYDSPGSADVERRPVTGGMRIVFLRDRPRSALSMLPDVFERAALFKPIGPWALWVLFGAVAAGIPLLLGAALRTAAHEEGEREGRT